MAFSFSSPGAAANGNAQASEGPELQEIQTNELGFLPIAGESKLKLLPTPWPSEALPRPTSSLLSIASSKGLLAAAGPDTLVLASTEAIREAFHAQKTFEPQVKISVPRLAQLAFSADENVLVISGADSGGLAAYEVAGLMNGKTEPALQISTNNAPLRALAPNPAESFAELFAVVTNNGELLMANLKSGQLVNGAGGPVLKPSVSCVSWSNKGKQLVAGLADGSASQMTQDGQIKAEIPRPPSLETNMHVSSIAWLENDTFFMAYTPSDADDSGLVPPSHFYIIHRQPKTTNYSYQKLPDVCTPFGSNRTPSVQMVARLRNFPPDLQDALIVCSTSSPDIGLVTKSGKPLSTDNVIGSYTMTSMSDDSRRAALPLSGSSETSPIGMALDLSAKDKIDNPIPGDTEILQSDNPVPNIMVLNNEGVLASWWIIYSPSIRDKTVYPGLAVVPKDQTARESSAPPASPAGSASAFGQSSFGQSPKAQGSSFNTQPAFGQLAFGQSGFSAPKPAPAPAAPAFGQNGFGSNQSAVKPFGSSGASTFGQSGFGGMAASSPAGGSPFGAASAFGGAGRTGFGQPSPLGNAKPAASSTTFGQPAFGNTSKPGAAGTAFGSPSSLGNRSLFAAAANNTPQFGQSGFSSGGGFASAAKGPSPFSTPSDAAKSGFSSFAGAGGFSAIKPSNESPFSKPVTDSIFNKPQAPSFGSNMDLSSGAGTPEQKPQSAGGLFGAPSGGFKLGSGFKSDDGTAADDSPEPKDGVSMFGGSFGNMLGEAAKEASPAQDKEEEMDESADEAPNQAEPAKESSPAPVDSATMRQPHQEESKPITPPSTVIHSKATPAPPLSNLFGTNTLANSTPAEVGKSKPFSFSSTTPTTTPKTIPFPAQRKEEPTPQIKTEPPSEEGSPALDDIPEAPLPPDSTSKTTYTMGDTSVSSVGSKTSSTPEAPLPPDFLPTKSQDRGTDKVEPPLPDDESELVSDFGGSQEDGSGVPSPTEVPSPTLERTDESEDVTSDFKVSPESSFGKDEGKTATGGLFTKITPVSPQPQSTHRPLFGEINKGAPIFPPPKIQESPRSPSPIRQFPPDFRPEATRSASAPIRPGSAIAARRAELSRTQANLPQPTAQEAQRIQQEKQVATKSKESASKPEDLEDDEADRLRAELERPVEPVEHLDPFLYHQESSEEPAKPGMAGQIERLYRDINSMIDTLGLNSRALSAFMLYQEDSQQQDETWPDVLISEDPAKANDEEWRLVDIERLDQGYDLLEDLIEEARIEDVPGKIQACQKLLNKDIVQLRTKLSSLRKTLHPSTNIPNAAKMGLSSEQASIQHDLRKASMTLQTKLAETEQALSVLRAKLAEVPQESTKGINGRGAPLKKPTVEAVTATINKMTLMAEQKSADIDVLEAQLMKLNMGTGTMNGSVNGSRQASVEPESQREASVERLLQHRTPQRSASKLGDPVLLRTPGSGGTVFHTPDSRFGGSVRSTPGRFRSSLRDSVTEDGILVSVEDANKWRGRARRKREVQAALKEALQTGKVKKIGYTA